MLFHFAYYFNLVLGRFDLAELLRIDGRGLLPRSAPQKGIT
jgi:hypothetical protein